MSNFEIITNSAIAEGIFSKEEAEQIIGAGFRLPLHTFQEWRRLGYSVKKGEKARMTCRIWKWKKEKADAPAQDGEINEEEISQYYLTKAFFFTHEQVEKIEQGAC